MRARTLVVVLLVVSGCGADSDIGARYQLERAYYEASQMERRAYATYPVDAYQDWRAAVDAYHGVLLSNPAHIPESVHWNPRIVADMEQVALAAEIGLLRLDMVDYRFHDAVTHRADVDRPISATFGPVTLNRVPALYDSLGEDPTTERAGRRLRAIVSNPVLWSGTTLLRDSLLAAPFLLMGQSDEAMLAAEGFYSRVITSWPDSAAAARALDYRARVLMARGQMDAALADVEVAAATHPDGARRVHLEMIRCDLLGFALERTQEASELLRGIVQRDPGADAAWQARVRLALFDPPRGVTSQDQLRLIHMDARAPYDVAAAALFARATLALRGSDPGAALDLYWRLTQRFPDSMPALAAPLLVIQTLLQRGDRDLAATALKRAADFYTQVIRRDSAALEARHLPKDCLLEAYLLFDRPEDAVKGLQSAAEGTSADNRVATAVKVALVRRDLQENLENTVEILQKSLEQFPGSRYARCVRWKLQRTREARDG